MYEDTGEGQILMNMVCLLSSCAYCLNQPDQKCVYDSSERQRQQRNEYDVKVLFLLYIYLIL